MISPKFCRSSNAEPSKGSSKYIAEDSVGSLRSPLRSQEEERMNKPKPNEGHRAQRSRGNSDRNSLRPLHRKPTLNQFIGKEIADKIPLESSDCSERDTDRHSTFQLESRGHTRHATGQSTSRGVWSADGSTKRPRRYFTRQSSDPGQQDTSGRRNVRQRLGLRAVSAEHDVSDTSDQQQLNARKCLWSGGGAASDSTDAQSQGENEKGVLTEIQLARRQKDIDYGKNTLGYRLYKEQIPENQRRKVHPTTPNKHAPCSRRYWDNQVRRWRKALHDWDPPSEDATSDKHSQTGAATHSPPSSVLSASPTNSALDTASDTGYDTVQDASQPQEDVQLQDDEIVLKFQTSKVKTWEEMMLEEEEMENSVSGDVDEFCLDDVLSEDL